MNIKERFWDKVDKSDECWIWIANRDQKGYGNFSINGKLYKAHRVAWEWLFGPISNSLCICHHCDNPSCVNPGHLFIGTHKDNVADAMSKGRHRIPDRRGERNHNSKLTESQIIEIRTLHTHDELNQRQIAERYNVNPRAISDVVNRKSWQHIIGESR